MRFCVLGTRRLVCLASHFSISVLISAIIGCQASPGSAERSGSFDSGVEQAGATEKAPARSVAPTTSKLTKPISPIVLRYDTIAGANVVNTDSGALEVQWRFGSENADDALSICRRKQGEVEWREIQRIETRAGSFVDRSVEPGAYYEYWLDSPKNSHQYDRFINGASRGVAVHQRGRVLVLVDETLIERLEDSIAQLENDLIGDGWLVSRLAAPRHSLDSHRNMENLRSLVKDIEDVSSENDDLELIYVIGHVVIPMSGNHNPDGHGRRAFVADGLLGNTPDREFWHTAFGSVHNGSFTNRLFASVIRSGVGRVDFADFSFGTGSGETSDDAELRMINEYLARAHNYRHGIKTFPNRASVYTTSGRALERYMFMNAVRTSTALFDDGSDRLAVSNNFVDGQEDLWGFHAGTAGPTAVHTGSQAALTKASDLVNGSRFANSAFYMVDGSYLGEWNRGNNFLRALLACGEGLGSVWARETQWRFHSLGTGSPVGLAVRDSINLGVHNQINYLRATFLSYLGDPTLRMQVLSPPSNVQGRIAKNSIDLSWALSEDRNAQYFVYRSGEGLNGSFELLNTIPVNGRELFRTERRDNPDVYQVRAAAIVHTGSGSFTNLSQAAFWKP